MAYNTISFFIQGPSTFSQLALPDYTDLASLKQKLYSATGVPPEKQALSCEGIVLHGDTTPLSSFPLDGKTLQVSSNDTALLHALKSYNDVDSVQKFELTDKEYADRRDTVRSYKQRMGIGRFAPAAESTPAPKPEVAPPHMSLGDRCQDGSGRRGAIRFIGQVTKLPTPKGAPAPIWVGVEWDEPVPKPQPAAAATAGPNANSYTFAPALSGVDASSASISKSNHDGSVRGMSYFQCRPGHGSFVRPDRIEVGHQFAKEACEEEFEDI